MYCITNQAILQFMFTFTIPYKMLRRNEKKLKMLKSINGKKCAVIGHLNDLVICK